MKATPLLITTVALLFTSLLALAQADKQVWVQRFGGTVGTADLARNIAVGASGNIVVAGDSDEGGSSILVIQYSATGHGIWTNRYRASAEAHAAGVSLDRLGNVFVSGSSGCQFVMLAYSSLGIPLWTNLFNGSASPSYTERPSAPVVDHSANVYVTGPAGIGPSNGFATLKYSSTGIPLWTNYFFAVSTSGYLASGLAVDNAGQVVVRGGRSLIKYASNGATLWTRTCPGTGFLLDQLRSTAIDTSGSIFLLGQSGNGDNEFPNDLIVKYSSDGSALWTNGYLGYAQSLAVDAVDNIAVTGVVFPAESYSTIETLKYTAAGVPVWTNRYDLGDWNLPFCTVAAATNGEIFVSAYSPSGTNQVTIKYSAAGSAQWTRNANTGNESDEDYPRPHPALTIEPSGAALITGYFFNQSTTDFATRKYTGDGDEAWTAFHDGKIGGVDTPIAMVADSEGNIIVTGSAGDDYATIKYSPSGYALWTNYYDGLAHVWDQPTAIAVASNGNIYVTGASYPGDWEDVRPNYLTIAYTSEGVPLWTNLCASGGRPAAIAVDRNGDVLVTGNDDVVLGDGQWVTIKYSGAGTPLWTNRHESYTSWAADLAVDSRGDFVVVGRSAQQTFAAIKYSSSGSALWTNLYTCYPSNQLGPNGFATAVAVWTNGDIFVTGYNIDPYDRDNYDDGSQYDFVTIKYSAAGEALWTNIYGLEKVGDFGTDLVLDGSGNVVVTGYSAYPTSYLRNFVTIKYANNGTALWTNRYAGPGDPRDTSHAVAVDRVGNVFVTGSSAQSHHGDSITVAYSSEGVPLWTNRYHGPAGHDDGGYDLAVTGVGEVVVLGYSSGDFATVKYESGFILNITNAPTNQVVAVGTPVAFSVGVLGTAPFTFQWQRNGTNLVNGGNVSGATTSNLTLAAVTADAAGNYTVVISNPGGSVTSVVAVLSVPVFENVTATVAPGLPSGCSTLAWGDYDNDGRLDLFVGGFTSGDDGEDLWYAQLWRNTETGFTNVTATVGLGRTAAHSGSAAWGDFDKDGRLDLIFTGQTGLESETTEIWRNTGTGFVNVTVPNMTNVESSSVAWGDYDNDGRLDLLIMGFRYDVNENQVTVPTQLWRNTGSGFSNVTAMVTPGLPQVHSGSVAWADYDNDGRLDFLITGRDFTTQRPVSQLWRNTGNGFANVTATVTPGLPELMASSVAWGDYDNDGRLDFLIAGFSQTNNFSQSGFYYAQLWRNTGSGFTNMAATLAPGMAASYPISSSVAWGDYNNDGRMDFLLSGHCYPSEGTGTVSQVWESTETGFTNVTASVGLPLFTSGAWVDFDNDGRLDLFCTEYPWGRPQIWKNNTPLTNSPPHAPSSLAMTASSNAVMLSWNAAIDDQTPASGLTYNVRAGTTPGGSDLIGAHVNATNGYRRLPALGNAMMRHTLSLTGLTNGQTVYWSVQAMDTSFTGGPFAAETSVVSLPQLRIHRANATNAVVSWTPPTFGWVLQQSTNVSVHWTATASGTANPAIVPATNGLGYYRLYRP